MFVYEFREGSVSLSLRCLVRYFNHLIESMAKWGEGDPRWIVEERADATNVNNWHWYALCCVQGAYNSVENMEISGNLLILENSGKTQGI